MMFLSYSTAKSYPATRWLLLSLLMTLSGGCVSQGPEPPKVIDGTLDLSEWDFEKDGKVTLKGDWHFLVGSTSSGPSIRWSRFSSGRRARTGPSLLGAL